MKPIDVKPIKYIDSSKDIDKKDPKFKISNIFRISKYKTFLQEVTLKIGLKKFL